MGHFTTWVNLQAHLHARPTVLIARGFLGTEHLRKRELKSVRILLKNHSSSLQQSLSEINALTKSKSRSIASQITNPAYRKTYLVVISPNSYQRLTTSNIRSSWSRFKLSSKSLLQPLESHIWPLYAPIDMQNLPKSKLGQVVVRSNMLRITPLTHWRSYLVINCPNVHEKLTKSEIRYVIVCPNLG